MEQSSNSSSRFFGDSAAPGSPPPYCGQTKSDVIGPEKAPKESKRLFVVKRNGKQEAVCFDKITTRLRHLSEGLDEADIVLVAQKVVNGIYPGVKTSELDILASETAAYMTTVHPDYGALGARIAVSNLHKETLDSFSQTIDNLYNYVNPVNKLHCGIISKEAHSFIMSNAEV